MLPLGTIAPPFRLPDVSSGRSITLDDFPDATASLVMFICRHCPYVKHVQQELARIGRDYSGRPVAIVAISSNDAVAYPDDNPASLAEMVKEQGFTFPLQERLPPLALPTSSSSTRLGNWSTGANSTTAGRVTISQ